MKKQNKKLLLNIFRGIAVIVPFIWILSKVQGDLLMQAFRQIRWWTVPVFLLMAITTMFLQGVRWWVLLRAFSTKLPFFQSISYHFSSLFYSLVLPNSTAQEVVRTMFVVKDAGSRVSWSTAWICKIIGLIVSFAIAVYGLVTLYDSGISKTIFNAALGLFATICILFVVSFSKKLTSPLRKTAQKLIPSKFYSKVESLREGIYQFRTKKFNLTVAFIITAIAQFLVITSFAVIIKGITGSYYIIECFAFIPLIEIISMAQPITPNGIGVREALIALMFKHLQLSSEQLSVYIIISNLAVLLKLTGAIPILYKMIFKSVNPAKNIP